MFLQHVVEFMCGLTVKETKGILHYVGNRKQNTDDFHEISVCRLPEENPPLPTPHLFHLETWTLSTPFHFADIKGRFESLKGPHGDQSSN